MCVSLDNVTDVSSQTLLPTDDQPRHPEWLQLLQENFEPHAYQQHPGRLSSDSIQAGQWSE